MLVISWQLSSVGPHIFSGTKAPSLLKQHITVILINNTKIHLIISSVMEVIESLLCNFKVYVTDSRILGYFQGKVLHCTYLAACHQLLCSAQT